MKRRIISLFAAVVSALVPFRATLAGTIEDAAAAYRRGDYTTASRLLRSLADNGNATAQASLGMMYADGEGVSQDYSQAVVWLRKAAEQGEVLAQANLGMMYAKGQGVPQDYSQGIVWLRKAAEQGDARAQETVGTMYMFGHGVPQD